MRFILCLSYNGADFCGWQIQSAAPSVQQCLESTLTRLLGKPVAVTGAGRTDSGVHAANYVAHFDWEDSLPFEASDFCYKLNAMLHRSVTVHSVVPAADDFHARFSARERSYTYFIHRKKDPFAAPYSWQCGYPVLDFNAMNEACAALIGTHDFSCFEKTGGSNKTSLCTVTEALWKPYTPTHVEIMEYGLTPAGDVGWETCGHPRPHKREGPIEDGRGREATVSGPTSPAGEPGYWYFRVSADRFLRNMVRAIVGSLIEVGRGRRDPAWIAELIRSGSRGDAGESVPGHALFLSRVRY